MNQPDPARGKEVFNLDRAHVFHSWSAQGLISPLPVQTGKGSYFWDFDGNKFLDFSSQLVFTNIGFQHPKYAARRLLQNTHPYFEHSGGHFVHVVEATIDKCILWQLCGSWRVE